MASDPGKVRGGVEHVRRCVTSLSWIPSESVTGLPRLPFERGVTHYDEPPVDMVQDIDTLLSIGAGDGFRFANRLSAWIDASDGRVVRWGYAEDSRGVVGATRVFGGRLTVPAVPLDDVQAKPQAGTGWVRFEQTCGRRTGLPAPRRVHARPWFRFWPPSAWTTLALTIHADGAAEYELVAASPFPRHWVFGPDGVLALKSATMAFSQWYHLTRGEPALVVPVESSLERDLSFHLMHHGYKPRIAALRNGDVLCREDDVQPPGGELYLLLDGVLSASVGDRVLGQLGPGAVLGERALLERGRRTSTLRAVTPCVVAVVPAPEADIDLDRLAQLSDMHRREEHDTTP